MNGNMEGSIYERASIKIANFVPIGYRYFLPNFGSFGRAVSEEQAL
jgi:hypothetical protein